ncbi:hypothetical protein NX02_18600 [Sphingomonas sanxanigenens DSM 19645 = NX02]|uniref:Type VI secretion-associated protein n=1 Tax=Sphingomonas sanxanigenens DSM 19645 = NX02 TaxID=1123269 RepID=W0ABT4_9SPHN|nr:hypothetical protein NX02_18600 [Sphingomonas sanxanigenens DSM 19645 = NX02]
MVAALPGAAVTAAPYLVGKLPAHGDFVRRAVPRVAAAWDAWCSAGLDEARVRMGAAFAARHGAASPWRFCFDPGLIDRQWHVGAILPSHDRVDRAFLLVAGARAMAPPAPDAVEAFAGAVEACCRQAIDELWNADRLKAALDAIEASPWRSPAVEPPPPRLWTAHGEGMSARSLTPTSPGWRLITEMLDVEETK